MFSRTLSNSCVFKLLSNKIFISMLCISFYSYSFAQPPCTQPGQTVETAFPVCGATIFNQSMVPTCLGITPVTPSCDILSNCYFYKFTVVTSGTLAFLITPLTLADDYDYNLYNVTNATNVNQIYTNASLFKIGNYSADPGTTGCNGAGNGNCDPNSIRYNQLQNVVAGEKYILCVVNFDGTGDGYGLSFAGGTASITSSNPINYSNVYANCSNNKIIVELSRDVKCNSIASNGSDFALTNFAGSITAATSVQCAAGEFTTNKIELTLSTTIQPGSYSVVINTGTDGNTLLGICDEPMQVGLTKNFIVTNAQVAPKFFEVLPLVCNTTTIKVKYDKDVLCNSIAINGSDFEITGPSTVNIIGAAGVCSGIITSTNEINLTLQNPITTSGTYILKAKIGNDNNTVFDVCGLQQTVGNSISFVAASTVSADFTYTIKYGCEKDTVQFFNLSTNVNTWEWNFDDIPSGINNTSGLQSPTHIFSSFGSKNVKLKVINSICEDNKANIVNLDNEIKIGFSTLPKDSICLNIPFQFTSTATGINLLHEWNFGNNQISSLQNPLPVLYTAPGNYDVNYKITNNRNCSLIVQKRVTVLPLPKADFTVSKLKLCEDEKITFNGTVSGSVKDYLWNFGDGNILSDNLNPTKKYLLKRNYTISLLVNDKFCGSDKKMRDIEVVEKPKVELGPNLTLCNDEKITLAVDNVNSYTYSWSTGEITSQIIYGGLSNTIYLTVVNDICKVEDSVKIKVLPSCKVYMPSAFSPNADGINDILKALNADLSTNFELKIYNRFGQIVFTTNNPLQGWGGNFKGEKSPIGTYVWQLQFKEHNAKEMLYLKGTCILIR
jgi:gliding motility-associated-like protein